MKPLPTETAAAEPTQSLPVWIEFNRTNHAPAPFVFGEGEQFAAVVAYFRASEDAMPRKNSSWRDYVADAAVFHAEAALPALLSAARSGNEKAITSLASLARHAVSTLNDVALKAEHQECIRKTARPQATWPMLVGRRKALGCDPDSLFAATQLGKDNWLGRKSAKRFDPRAKFNKVLLRWLNDCEQHRNYERSMRFSITIAGPEWAKDALDLPPLSDKKKVHSLWESVIVKRLKEALADNDTKQELLAELGQLRTGGKPLTTYLPKQFRDALGRLLGRC